MEEKIQFSANPGAFDSNSIESVEAFKMLWGEQMDECNCWNRVNWKLRSDIEEVPGFLEEINAELYQIAHEPWLGSFVLKYFEGVH